MDRAAETSKILIFANSLKPQARIHIVFPFVGKYTNQLFILLFKAFLKEHLFVSKKDVLLIHFQSKTKIQNL